MDGKIEHSRFSDGRGSVEDEERLGRPSTGKTTEIFDISRTRP
jgi:hypothetical protein